MFLFLHGMAMLFGLLMGVPDGSGFSVHSADGGGISQPADGGGSIPGH